MSEKKEYILGADAKELFRLGVQHQIWAAEAQQGWQTAQFNEGQTLLDLGCGPGFCTKELAFLTGETGKVIGVDISQLYIDHLNKVKKLQHLNIEAICSNFNDMQLAPNSIDGMYCRWALAWIPNPKEILSKVYDALKPGAKMVIHEYYDWSTHQTEPRKEHLAKAINAALQSFKNSPGSIDIGRELPRMLGELNMKVTTVRLMPKLGLPNNAVWQWPKTFYHSYFPRLIGMGYLTETEVNEALREMDELEQTPGASLLSPIMTEVIAEK